MHEADFLEGVRKRLESMTSDAQQVLSHEGPEDAQTLLKNDLLPELRRLLADADSRWHDLNLAQIKRTNEPTKT